ncbi:hypothetical protein AF336_35045 [Bradyrhizobium diazoefficiens]|nr:hypothetical protein AF336_35045 [Bradyrhizobium diazoefficiens]
MRSCFCLLRFAKKMFAFETRRHCLDLRPQPLGFPCKTFIQSFGLFETTPFLHGALLSFEKAGSAIGVLITDISTIRAVIESSYTSSRKPDLTNVKTWRILLGHWHAAVLLT